jgi:hypothetical protein
MTKHKAWTTTCFAGRAILNKKFRQRIIELSIYLSIDRSNRIESNLYNLILSYLIYLSILYMIHIYIIFNVIIHNSNPSTFIHFLALHYPPSHPRATDFLCFWRSHRIQQSWALPEGNHSGHPLEQCSKSRSFHEIPTG